MDFFPRRRDRRRAFGTWSFLAVVVGGTWLLMIHMPGRSHQGPLPAMSGEEAALEKRLQVHVRRLAGEIGERNLERPEALDAAALSIEEGFGALGYAVVRQEFLVGGQAVRNVETEKKGGSRGDEIVLVGSHYDSVSGSPGGNDNATGVAANLEIARLLRGTALARTVRFAAFVNEEPPFFQTEAMGSWMHARRSRQRGERIVAMLSLETIGCYSDAPGSQDYPFPFGLFYPATGNFIGFVGSTASRDLVHRAITSFRAHTAFPSEGLAAPAIVPGVAWSDHWAFWEHGYPAIMVTDTALFRDPNYHSPGDTWDKVDYSRMARVVAGLARVVAHLAGTGEGR